MEKGLAVPPQNMIDLCLLITSGEEEGACPASLGHTKLVSVNYIQHRYLERGGVLPP